MPPPSGLSPALHRHRSGSPGSPGAQPPIRPVAARLPLPASHLATIEQSHQRCAAQGLSRICAPDHAPLAPAELARVRERNLRLHTHAAPVMEMLFEQIAGTQSLVVLCDARGTIIHSIGDDDFLGRAAQVALAPGVNWSEPAKGTNAIGTALIEEAPTLVHADEHFIYANHFLTCSAAPILDPRGNVLGVLDVTGDHRSYHQHTMALVRMSTRMIENHWLSDDHRHAMRLHFHSRLAFVGTLMEGILAVAPDGHILGANRGALEQLGLSGAALRMHSLASLFGTSVGELADRFRNPLAVPLALHDGRGRLFHLLARLDWPAWHVLGQAQPLAEPSTPALPGGVAGRHAATRDGPAGALDELDTGDPQVAEIISRLRRVLDCGIALLIQGETGTGKTRLARALHQCSARRGRVFVGVNCASLDRAGGAAALFGDGDKPGALQRAQGGTLFLDEISELPLPLQARLLRQLWPTDTDTDTDTDTVIDARTPSFPLTGSLDKPCVQAEPVVAPQGSPACVGPSGLGNPPRGLTLVCASRVRLPLHMQQGLFREDLYHRLNGLAVTLPPLRQRQDLPLLLQRVLHGLAGGRSLQLSPAALALLQAHPWPGNLHQMQNVLRAAVALAGADALIQPQHLPEDVVDTALAERPQSHMTQAVIPAAALQPGGESLQDQQLRAIRAAVAAAEGNISVAARQLGVSRNTIYRRLREAPPV